jgi:hypothetical protein
MIGGSRLLCLLAHGGSCVPSPFFGVVCFWVCFRGVFVVWWCFLVCFGFDLLLNSYWFAWVVFGAVFGVFSGFLLVFGFVFGF